MQYQYIVPKGNLILRIKRAPSSKVELFCFFLKELQRALLYLHPFLGVPREISVILLSTILILFSTFSPRCCIWWFLWRCWHWYTRRNLWGPGGFYPTSLQQCIGCSKWWHYAPKTATNKQDAHRINFLYQPESNNTGSWQQSANIQEEQICSLQEKLSLGFIECGHHICCLHVSNGSCVVHDHTSKNRTKCFGTSISRLVKWHM